MVLFPGLLTLSALRVIDLGSFLQTHYSTQRQPATFQPNEHSLVHSNAHKKCCLTVVCETGLLLLKVEAADASQGVGLVESSSIIPLLSKTLEERKTDLYNPVIRCGIFLTYV